jgi:hypothetical protein
LSVGTTVGRKPHPPPVEAECKSCHKLFTRRTGKGGAPQLYCSPDCRVTFWRNDPDRVKKQKEATVEWRRRQRPHRCWCGAVPPPNHVYCRPSHRPGFMRLQRKAEYSAALALMEKQRREREQSAIAPLNARPIKGVHYERQWIKKLRTSRAIVHTCPRCSSTIVSREPDGTWICSRCPWVWIGWRNK